MKDWKTWGVKFREFPDYNYKSVWNNLETLRLGTGIAKELPIDKKEFYDVSLGTVCNCECDFCYVSATSKGKFFTNICEKAKFFFGNMSENDKPFQIAIGSTGEPTIHPNFLEFLKTIYELGIVPNYTTNGITLSRDDEYSEKLLEYTDRYCGGIAISINKFTEGHWQRALDKVIKNGNIHINLHYIIKDENSIIELKKLYDTYYNHVRYFILLPLMPSGRSKEKFNDNVFKYFLEIFKNNMEKISFGAHFYDEILKNRNEIKIWEYPPESLSANLILDDEITLTKSSFNLTPVKIINYEY